LNAFSITQQVSGREQIEDDFKTDANEENRPGLLKSNEKRPGLDAFAGAIYHYFVRRLLRKHVASDLLVSLDLHAEGCCPAMDSSWKCPVEGCSGSDFRVSG
jgi:hypothetical protein